MNTLLTHKSFAILLLLSSPLISFSQDNNPIIRLIEKYKKNQPLVLDQSIAYASVASPKNFYPTKLHSFTDLNRPLSNGDYSVNVVFYCTQWCLHGPGKGVPYKLGRASGKMSKPISALLYQGTLKKINRKQLNTTAWKIQDGIKYEDMNTGDQLLIDQLIGQYKNQLVERPLDKFIKIIIKYLLKMSY